MQKIVNAIRSISQKKLRYLMVGAWNTLAGCSIFAGAYAIWGTTVHYLVIAILSHFVAVLQSWLTFRYLVFQSTAPRLREYLRFNISSLLILAIQMSGLWLLVDCFNLHPMLSQPVLVTMTVIAGYFVHSAFSFRKPMFKVDEL